MNTSFDKVIGLNLKALDICQICITVSKFLDSGEPIGILITKRVHNRP